MTVARINLSWLVFGVLTFGAPQAASTIRGDAAFDWGMSEQVTSGHSFRVNGVPIATSTTTTTFRHSSATVGLSGLITVSRSEQLRLYIAPRVAWRNLHSSLATQSQSTGTATRVPPGFESDRSVSTTSNGVELDAMFGANYRLSDRFAVFGEAGLAYIRPTATSSSSNRLNSYSVGSRSDVGIAIHF